MNETQLGGEATPAPARFRVLPLEVKVPGRETLALLIYLVFVAGFLAWGLNRIHAAFPHEPSTSIAVLVAKLLVFVIIPGLLWRALWGFRVHDYFKLGRWRTHLWPGVWMSAVLIAFQVIFGQGLATIRQSGLKAEKVWGEVIEDRGSQITFSALGQQAPLEEKRKRDPDFTKRKKMKAILDALIPEFSVQLGGSTSIDVTKPGIDKAYGMKKLMEILDINKEDILFIGDRIIEGGNDYPVKLIGIDCLQISKWEETALAVEAILHVQ